MIDLDRLNSATKYPSIPTYHALGERGLLTEEVTAFDDEVILTEKIDGTNSRIILLPDGDWFIGSREEMLTARGDRVSNPALGIVEALRPLAQRVAGEDAQDCVQVFYLETYGAKIGGAARQYTAAGKTGWRMFDLAWIPLEVLSWDRVRIAAWREGGAQTWSTEATLHRAAEKVGVELTPRLATVPGQGLPRTVERTGDWLVEQLPTTLAGLDEGAGGYPEGIVLRTGDRSIIAKARVQDYERTLKRRYDEAAKTRKKAVPEERLA